MLALHIVVVLVHLALKAAGEKDIMRRATVRVSGGIVVDEKKPLSTEDCGECNLNLDNLEHSDVFAEPGWVAHKYNTEVKFKNVCSIQGKQIHLRMEFCEGYTGKTVENGLIGDMYRLNLKVSTQTTVKFTLMDGNDDANPNIVKSAVLSVLAFDKGVDETHQWFTTVSPSAEKHGSQVEKSIGNGLSNFLAPRQGHMTDAPFSSHDMTPDVVSSTVVLRYSTVSWTITFGIDGPDHHGTYSYGRFFYLSGGTPLKQTFCFDKMDCTACSGNPCTLNPTSDCVPNPMFNPVPNPRPNPWTPSPWPNPLPHHPIPYPTTPTQRPTNPKPTLPAPNPTRISTPAPPNKSPSFAPAPHTFPTPRPTNPKPTLPAPNPTQISTPAAPTMSPTLAPAPPTFQPTPVPTRATCVDWFNKVDYVEGTKMVPAPYRRRRTCRIVLSYYGHRRRYACPSTIYRPQTVQHNRTAIYPSASWRRRSLASCEKVFGDEFWEAGTGDEHEQKFNRESSAIVIPPLTKYLRMSSTNIWELTAYVNSGGRLVVIDGPKSFGVKFLNLVFGLKIQEQSKKYSQIYRAKSTCYLLCNAPALLPAFDTNVFTSSLPDGARVEYGDNESTHIFSFHVGSGIVVYISRTTSTDKHTDMAAVYKKAFTGKPHRTMYAERIATRKAAKKWTQPTAGRYVLGTPGGAWTLDEVLAVKSKLWRLFSKTQSEAALDELFPHGNPYNKHFDTYRPAGKMVRLGFHDCLLYSDLSGGCDGCLHWDGMGARFGEGTEFPRFQQKTFKAKSGVTHNNGLGPVVELLEWIYKDPNFPERTPSLNHSLYDTGKSRADLWALAAIVGVEYTTMINNNVCKDPYFENPFHGKEGPFYPDLPNGGIHCNEMQGKTGCEVEFTRPLKFRYGRKDCAPTLGLGRDYATLKKESHPDAEANGATTLKWFKDNFNFTYRETAAIMGAHTLGRMHKTHGLFRYLWVFRGGMQFNNQYYKNMVSKPRTMFYNGSHDKCDGQFSDKTRIVLKAQSDTTVGGPIQWILENKLPQSMTQTTMFDTPPVGSEEMMLSSDMGLYWHFNVDSNKFPTDCTGLTSTLGNRGVFNSFSTFVGGPLFTEGAVECNSQTAQESGDSAVHEIIEDYANNQATWLRDFVPAFEKMLSNGYAQNQLIDGPDQFTNVTCSNREDVSNKHRYWVCFSSTQIGTQKVRIRNPSDYKTLHWNAAKKAAELKVIHQYYWHWIGERQLVDNEKNVLSVEGCATWTLEKQKLKCCEVTRQINPLEGKYLTRNGSSVFLASDSKTLQQQWLMS